MIRCNKIVNKLFKNEIVIENNINSKIIIRNMSILSKRQIFDKPQELRPTTQSNYKNKKDSINKKKEEEKKREEEEFDRLIENKRLEFEKQNQKNNVDTNNNNNNKKLQSQLLGYEDLFEEYDENEEVDIKIEQLLEASKRGDKKEVLKLGEEYILNHSPEEIEQQEQEQRLQQQKQQNSPNNPMNDALKLFNSDNLASEYVTRLLIEQFQTKNRLDDTIHSIIVNLPEWQDYNNEVLREVAKLELQEGMYDGDDSSRVTKYWQVQRIKLVESIRRNHSKRVGDAVAKKLKQVSKEIQKEIDEHDVVLQKRTGLTLDQLKQHKDYAHFYRENSDEDEENELFKENEYDKLLKTLVGSDVDNIPKQVKEIFYTTTKSIEATKEKDKFLFEQAEIETKRQQEEQPQYQYQQQQQRKPQQTISKTLNFSDIVMKDQQKQKQKQQQQQQQQQNQQQEHMDVDDFDLKSILNSMSEKK
ncbi:hypothetical protein ACTFIV_008755 [Dictyostelium citrinum]